MWSGRDRLGWCTSGAPRGRRASFTPKTAPSMNQKTARLLRTAQLNADGHLRNYRNAKRAWNQTPRPERAVWRKIAKASLTPA